MHREWNLWPSLLGGIIAFFLSAVLIVSYATVLSPGARNVYFNGACDLATIGTVVFGLYTASTSRVPFALSTVDVFTAPIIATIDRQVVSLLGENTNAGLSTLLVAILGAFSIMGGTMAWVGYMDYVSIVRYLPYPGTFKGEFHSLS